PRRRRPGLRAQRDHRLHRRGSAAVRRRCAGNRLAGSGDRRAEPVRAFLGVAVAAPALAAAVSLLAELRRDVADVRWVRDEGLHLTIHFFGALPADRVDAAVAAVAPAAAATSPFRVRLAGLGSFPAGRRERVLWIGASEGTAEMAALAE